MSPETRHLIYWWWQWLKRLLTTSLHIVYRPSYRHWKAKRDRNAILNSNICTWDGVGENDEFF